MSLTKTILVLVVLMVCGASAFASGYQINEHGARAMGMGGAYAAQASDGSAIFFNPAGLAFQSGFNVMLGTTIIMPRTSFKATTKTVGTTSTSVGTESKMVEQTFTPINAYFTYALSNGLTVGVGVYNPYGLGSEWANNWDGRQMAVKTDLMTFYINPTIAYKVSDQFAVGVGFSYVTGSVKLKRRVYTFSALAPQPAPAANDGTVDLDGTGTGFNWNLGILYKPTSDLSIGVSYRALTKIDFSGDAKFSDMLALASFFPGGSGKTTLPMPSNLFAGIAYNVTKDLTVEADFQYVGWSAYDQLKLDIPTGPVFPSTPPAPLQGATTQLKNWEDAYLFRIGAEYRMDKLALRAGFIYDKTAQPDAAVEPMLPDANRMEVTLGVGYEISKTISVSAAYQLINGSDRNGKISSKTALPTTIVPETFYSGSYTNTANLFAVNLGLSF